MHVHVHVHVPHSKVYMYMSISNVHTCMVLEVSVLQFSSVSCSIKLAYTLPTAALPPPIIQMLGPTHQPTRVCSHRLVWEEQMGGCVMPGWSSYCFASAMDPIKKVCLVSVQRVRDMHVQLQYM